MCNILYIAWQISGKEGVYDMRIYPFDHRVYTSLLITANLLTDYKTIQKKKEKKTRLCKI